MNLIKNTLLLTFLLADQTSFASQKSVEQKFTIEQAQPATKEQINKLKQIILVRPQLSRLKKFFKKNNVTLKDVGFDSIAMFMGPWWDHKDAKKVEQAIQELDSHGLTFTEKNICDSICYPKLLTALVSNQSKIVQNSKDNEALHYAAIYARNLQAVQLLVQTGADPNKTDLLEQVIRAKYQAAKERKYGNAKQYNAVATFLIDYNLKNEIQTKLSEDRNINFEYNRITQNLYSYSALEIFGKLQGYVLPDLANVTVEYLFGPESKIKFTTTK